MIQRRQFLGSVAAVCAISGSARLASAMAFSSETLNWHSRVIETLPQGRNRRAPVVTDVSLQIGGKLLAIVGDDHFVSIYDLENDRFTQNLDRHSDWVRVAKFSNDGKLLATAGNDRKRNEHPTA